MKARMAISSTVVVLAVSMSSLAAHAARFTVNVVDGDGQPVTGFRWIVEEDNTHPVVPGVTIDRSGIPAANANTPTNVGEMDTRLSSDFHAS